MAERVIVPYICYEGEGNYPATGRYVIWYRCYKLMGNMQKIECHLAYTDEDGKLHPLGDDFFNPYINKVIFDGEYFRIYNFKGWFEVKREFPHIYNNPVRFGADDFVGLFFVPLYTVGFVSLKELLDKDLIREGRVLRGKESLKYPKEDEKYWIALPGDYPIYLARMRALIKELDKRLKAARKRIGFLLACASLLDQAGNLVAARARSAWDSYFLRLPQNKKGHALFVYFETRLLQEELINPLKDVISRLVKQSSEKAKERIDEVASELARLLKNPRHNQTYNAYFQKYFEEGKEIPKEVRESYMYAYSLLSCSHIGEEIYKEHIKEFLSKFNSKDKNQIKGAIESINQQARWVSAFRDEIMGVVTAYGTIKLANELTALRDDVIAASRFLENKGIAHNIDELEDKLNKAIIHDTRVDASDYFNISPESYGWKAFNIATNALTLANVLTKEHETITDKIESSKEIIGIMGELSKMRSIQERIPLAPVLEKTTGPIISLLDYGLSVHSLYKKADTGKGDEFSLAVASYCGKGLILGGSILSLTPFAPLGIGLLAVGGAIDLLADVAGWVISYKSADLRKFEEVFEKIKKLDKNGEIYVHFEVLSNRKVSETKYYQELVKEPELKKAINKKWTSLWGDNPLKLKEIIENYFNNHYWGLIEELT